VRIFRAAELLPAALLLLPVTLAAQVRLGEISASENGTISTGYSASYGNLTGSSHGWTVGGATSLSGSFYNPNFLSFNASLYLNQSRANSDFQSISDASGVNLSTSIFSGSKFPGSVSYTKSYNSEGNYAVPGLANYVTHGNSDTFGINWSENLPAMPNLSAGFQLGTSKYSVYGTNDQGNNAFHSLNLHSGYQLAGFNMAAYYSNGGSHSLIPQLVTGLQSTESHTGNTSYGFNATNHLPLQGSFSAGVNRSEWNSKYLGYSSTGAIDLLNVVAAIHPIKKLSFSVSSDYSDNLSGQLIQSVISAGGVVSGLNADTSSNSLELMSSASYSPGANLQMTAFFERRTQEFFGENYGVRSYGASAIYAHTLLNGTFNSSMIVTANNSENSGVDTLGFSTTENYSSVVLGWHANESFSYAQNVQTLLVTYMNSFYNYSANVRRNWGQFNLSAGVGGSRTALTEQAGTANSNESYNASLGYGVWLTGTGSYSKSSGEAIATGAGLVPVPVPSPILPSDLVSLFGGDSYAIGLSSTPVKKLIMGASYAKSLSNTSTDAISSTNQNSELTTLIQYQFRKLNFVSGYARLEQGFSGSGSPPEVIATYYAGVSRWFNFF
jgi:hypothetical protein